MLKIYNVRGMCQVNDDPWDTCGSLGCVCMDDSEAVKEKVVIDRKSFHATCNWIRRHSPDGSGLVYGKTFFLHRPYFEVWHKWNEADRYFQQDIITFSYKLVYQEKKEVTLEWLMQHISADQMIQFFKDRGMTICPMNV